MTSNVLIKKVMSKPTGKALSFSLYTQWIIYASSLGITTAATKAYVMMVPGTPGATGSQRSDAQDNFKLNAVNDEVVADPPKLVLYNRHRIVSYPRGPDPTILSSGPEDSNNLAVMSWAGNIYRQNGKID